MLFEAAGRDHVDIVRKQFVSPATPVQWDSLPRKSLILLFASRTGSTYAAQLLSNTAYFERMDEAFNSRQLEKMRKKHGLKDHAEAAKLTVSELKTEHGFAAKCGIPGLIGAELTGFLDAAWDGLSFIRLKRRDTLAQAVSNFRAQLSGRYHSTQSGERTVREEDYDRGRIEELLDLIDRINERLDIFVELSGKPVPIFYYEDICERPRQFVKQALRHFGLEAPDTVDTDVRLEVLRDDINAAWMERYRAGR